MDQPTGTPAIHPQVAKKSGVHWVGILRDILIILVLTFIGGFIIGISGGASGSQRNTLAIAASNLLLGTVGFVISGCLAVGNRWLHLSVVAFGVWIAGLLNVVLLGYNIAHWLISIVAILLMMGVGGALSYLFRRQTKVAV